MSANALGGLFDKGNDSSLLFFFLLLVILFSNSYKGYGC